MPNNPPQRLTVVKVGGHELDSPAFLDGLIDVLAHWHGAVLLVHGGGKEISATLERYGETVQFVDGLRVTPPSSMAIMEMVVCGSINKRLVARLHAAGQVALGISGVDLGVLRCVPLQHDGQLLGRVGDVTQVNSDALDHMLLQGWVPVLAPVALGADDFLPYNVNADHAAKAVAVALARGGRVPVELVFISNIPGVLHNGVVVPTLDAARTAALIADGTIGGGMVPKVRSALHALTQGVAAVRITNVAGAHDGGTRIVGVADDC